MRSVSYCVLKKALKRGAAVATMIVAVSCDSTGPAAPSPVPEVPEVPKPPEGPAGVSIMRGQMVFGDQSGVFYSISIADSNGVRLSTLSQGDDPAVSPNGEKIAFASAEPFAWGPDIWVMNPDGSNSVRLTHTADARSSSTSPAWSPDGKRIAFVTTTGVWEHEIFVMNADGSAVVQLTDDDDAYSVAPEWSADGRRILFSHVSNHAENSGIFEMNPDGSNMRQLTPGHFDLEPTRSPDATRIAFIRDQGLFVMNADGSNVTQLMGVGVDWEGTLTWSPDGKSIVFGIRSNSKMCIGWDYNEYACGRDLKRVGLDGNIIPTWSVIGAFNSAWQR